MLASLNLHGIGPAQNLDMQLGQRVNLFTGDNGLGKSFILECAWWALSGHWPGLPAFPRDAAGQSDPEIRYEVTDATGKLYSGLSLYDWESQEWSSPSDRPNIPGLLIYARMDGAFAIWDPTRNQQTSSKASSFAPLAFTQSDIWDGLRDEEAGKTTYLSNGLIADWIHWQNGPNEEPFRTLKNVLLRLSPPGIERGDMGRLEPGAPQRLPRDSRLIPTIRHSYGQVPVVYASAGVRRILALAYLIVWAWEEHKTQSRLIRKAPQKRMVILIDEIEAHLHPQWQRTILPALLDVWKDLAQDLQIQLLIATHSPLVMASMEPFFDDSGDKIFHLDVAQSSQSGTEVVVQEQDFVKYGSVDSWLRSDVFELAQARSLQAEKAIEDARRLQEAEVVTKENVIEVSDRLIKYLAANDGFWSRWLYFADRHGVDL
ncbi:MAG: ATP-binding protein [Chloroflexi bacterium]|nr:MAG: ATP-binding protein [Chloroflexota bacterium]